MTDLVKRSYDPRSPQYNLLLALKEREAHLASAEANAKSANERAEHLREEIAKFKEALEVLDTITETKA